MCVPQKGMGAFEGLGLVGLFDDFIAIWALVLGLFFKLADVYDPFAPRFSGELLDDLLAILAIEGLGGGTGCKAANGGRGE